MSLSLGGLPERGQHGEVLYPASHAPSIVGKAHMPTSLSLPLVRSSVLTAFFISCSPLMHPPDNCVRLQFGPQSIGASALIRVGVSFLFPASEEPTITHILYLNNVLLLGFLASLCGSVSFRGGLSRSDPNLNLQASSCIKLKSQTISSLAGFSIWPSVVKLVKQNHVTHTQICPHYW